MRLCWNGRVMTALRRAPRCVIVGDIIISSEHNNCDIFRCTAAPGPRLMVFIPGNSAHIDTITRQRRRAFPRRTLPCENLYSKTPFLPQFSRTSVKSEDRTKTLIKIGHKHWPVIGSEGHPSRHVVPETCFEVRTGRPKLIIFPHVLCVHLHENQGSEYNRK